VTRHSRFPTPKPRSPPQGSKDKTLHVFSAGEGGSQHVNADDPDPARQLIVDWFARRLGTLPAPSA